MAGFDGYFKQVNPAWTNTLGWTEEELLSKPRIEFVHPDDREATENAGFQLREGHPVLVFENRYICRDGSFRWLSWNSFPLSHEGLIFAVARDITALKKTTDDLRESEARFRLLFDNMLEAFAHCRMLFEDHEPADFIFLDVNDSFERLTGLRNAVGRKVSEVVPGIRDSNPELFETYGRVALTGNPEKFDTYVLPLRTWFSISVYSTKEEHFVMVFDNITDRKEAADALRESEHKYRLVVENAHEGIVVVQDNVFRFVNPKMGELLGYDMEELLNRDFRDFVHQEDAFTILDRHERSVKGEDVPNRYPIRIVRRNGNVRWAELCAAIVNWEGTPAALVFLADIDKRRRAEEAQLRLATAIEQAAESVIITDTSGNIQYANPAFERITGYSTDEVIGKHPRFLRSDAHDESFYANLEKCVRKGDTWSGRFIGRKKDGEQFYADTTISPVRDSSGNVTNFVQLGHDVSERLHLEKQLFQAQKMESIGMLAGGIAHDFNNLLTVILGYSELLLTGTDKGAAHYSDLEAIHFAATRGADLAKRILTFSRKIETEPRPIDLNEEIRNANKLLYRTLPKMIEIRLALADDLKRVNADPGQMEQILLNLAVNARDSMPGGGKFVIETRNVTLDEDYCAPRVDATPGDYVLLRVSDTGHGMESEVVDRIFEPFFSTKKPGEGTGLGLAMVFGIVKGHGGHVTCYSEPGVGTSFHIYLPVIGLEEKDEESLTREEPAGGTETLLLVDDEELIRDLGTRILRGAGYSVLRAEDGKEALEIFEQKRSAISLVILDLVMPKMGGAECLESLLKANPEVKVLIASGLLSIAGTKEIIGTKAKGFISKPFERTKLLRTVRAVLDER